MQRWTLWAALLGGLALSACNGEVDVDRPWRPGGSVAPGGGSAAFGDESCEAISEPSGVPAPTRRLTRSEYNLTVSDLLKIQSRIADGFVPDAISSGFDNNAAAQSVSEQMVEQYLFAAEALSEQANLTTLLPCSQTGANDACARSFISDFGMRAYRRPLDAEEEARLFRVFTTGRTQGGSFSAGIRTVVQTALQSPHFLYRLELATFGQTAAAVALTPFELASRLSYLILGSMPDAELFAAAKSGKLKTREEVRTHAERLLKLPQARARVADFHQQWLGLKSFDTVDKGAGLTASEWTALRSAFTEETERFLEDTFWNDGHFGTLLAAEHSFLNSNLAQFYGAPVPSSSGFVKSALGNKRRGLLTQGSLLARYSHRDTTSPLHRGKFIRERFLCQILSPPPPNVDNSPPVPQTGTTMRERMAQHLSKSSCKGCHMLADPIGFAFENFDAVGAWRDTEAGSPVDASGEIFSAGEALDGKFNGVIELSTRLSQSQLVKDCMMLNWFRFAHGRDETEADACSLYQVRKTFTASGERLPQVLLALIESDAFFYRRPSEVTP